jgi:hypothetical protein
MGQRSETAERVDRHARNGGWLSPLVRVGLVAYALVHLLLAWVAIRIVFTSHAGAATGAGAMAQLAQGGLGRWAVGLMSVAFAALVVWQLIAMVVGYREDEGWRRRLMQAGAGCRAVTYGYFAWAAGRVALHQTSGSGRSAQSTTSRVLDAPAGQAALVLVGAVVVGIGIGLAVFGWRRGFLSQLEPDAKQSDRRTPIVVIGVVGYVVKGAAFAIIGVLLAWAALTHDPHKTGGLDQSLFELLGGTAGRIAVIVVGVGIGAFGCFLLARARHLHVERLTS